LQNEALLPPSKKPVKVASLEDAHLYGNRAAKEIAAKQGK
jgi:hypothetical protein